MKQYYLKNRVLKVGKRSSPKKPINCMICNVLVYKTGANQKVCISCKPEVDRINRNKAFVKKYNSNPEFRKHRQELNIKNRAIWLSKNEDKERLRRRIYQNKRRANIGNFDIKIFQMVFEDNIKKYGTLTCILCLEPIVMGNDSLEHKIPISRGGTNAYENLGISHKNCNSRKHARTVEEYQKLIGVEIE